MKNVTVFYATLLYGEYDKISRAELLDLPEDVFLYYRIPAVGTHWYRKDLTPRTEDDVPKELRLLALLMS